MRKRKERDIQAPCANFDRTFRWSAQLRPARFSDSHVSARGKLERSVLHLIPESTPRWLSINIGAISHACSEDCTIRVKNNWDIFFNEFLETHFIFNKRIICFVEDCSSFWRWKKYLDARVAFIYLDSVA